MYMEHVDNQYKWKEINWNMTPTEYQNYVLPVIDGWVLAFFSQMNNVLLIS